MYILSAIKDLITGKPVLFTTPGHSQNFCTSSEFAQVFGKSVFNGDFSEVEGMDNLQNPTGAILKSQQRAAKTYGSRETFFLVNGSSSGIIAMMLATVQPGEKVLIARNAHKSVINALVLSKAVPVWIETEWNEDWNIPAGVSADKIKEKLDEIPDIKAVLVTSPTYEGIVSDIKSIAGICRKKNVPLLVDEAHGALWNFSKRLPTSAINLGADACAQSLHKTGSCLNQGALLHLSKNSCLQAEKVQQALNTINTTSPSYPLLASIEASIEYLNSKRGREKLNDILNNINDTKEHLKTRTDAVFLEGSNHDMTKLFFGLNEIKGQALSDFLEKKFNIEVELNNNRGVLALTGIGTDLKKLKILAKGVKKADKKLKKKERSFKSNPLILPETVLTPSEAFYRESAPAPCKEAVGRISKETIVAYPPGIPVVIAGERLQEGHLKLLKKHEYIQIIKEF